MSENVKQYPLIVRSHGLDEVPEHLIPFCPLCGNKMEKCESDSAYQFDFDLYEAYKDAGFNLDIDVFSYASDLYECAECEKCDPDEQDMPSEVIDSIRWYYLYGDVYQPRIPIHPSEYETIYSLMYQKNILEHGQQVLDGFPIPDFSELEGIIVDPF